MAHTQEIKERITSIESTQKITNAMFMISSTKLARAKRDLEAIRPYFYGIQNLIERMLRHIPHVEHPFLRDDPKPEEQKTTGFLVITSDKGLAGAYNYNVLMETERLMEGKANTVLFVIGEVGRHHFAKRHVPIEKYFHEDTVSPTRDMARHIAFWILELYRNDRIDEMFVVYSAMKNPIQEEVRVTKLLPLRETLPHLEPQLMAEVPQEEFILQPTPKDVIDTVVPSYIRGFVFSTLIESFCAEQNSRMLAMQVANDSANDMLHDLRIQYNRERQASITQEITEITAGANARIKSRGRS